MKIDELWAVRDPGHSSEKPEDLICVPNSYEFREPRESKNPAYYSTREEAIRDAEERLVIKKIGWKEAFRREREARLEMEAVLVDMFDFTLPADFKKRASDAILKAQRAFSVAKPEPEPNPECDIPFEAPKAAPAPVAEEPAKS